MDRAGNGHLDAGALMRVLEVSRKLAAPFELNDLLSQIIDAGCQVLGADRASVFLHDAPARELYLIVAHGLKEIRFSIDKGIAGECARSRKVINVHDCYGDPRFNQDVDRDSGYRTNCLIAVPLIGVDDEVVGVLQLLNAKRGQFTQTDEQIAQVLASQAAAAIQRVRLIEDHLLKKKMENDLALAQKIQMGVLPSELPRCPGYELAAFARPADEVGGDIYDVAPALATLPTLDGLAGEHAAAANTALAAAAATPATPSSVATEVAPPAAAEQIVLLLADATGHGVGPALSVTQVHAMLRLGLRLSADLDDLFLHINRQLAQDLAPNRFITAFLGVLDTRAHTITYHSAGQAPLMHYHAAERRCESFNATTLPWGILDDIPIEPPQVLPMRPGDVFILLTDGFYEFHDPDDQQMGSERVEKIIKEHHDRSATQIVEALVRQTEAFGRGAPQADDLTAVIVKRLA